MLETRPSVSLQNSSLLRPSRHLTRSTLWSNGCTLEVQFVFHPQLSSATLSWAPPILTEIILQMLALVPALGFTQYSIHHRWISPSPHTKDLSQTCPIMDSRVSPVTLPVGGNHPFLCLSMQTLYCSLEITAPQ